jgi:hypothetical protein
LSESGMIHGPLSGSSVELAHLLQADMFPVHW